MTWTRRLHSGGQMERSAAAQGRREQKVPESEGGWTVAGIFLETPPGGAADHSLT